MLFLQYLSEELNQSKFLQLMIKFFERTKLAELRFSDWNGL